MVVQEEPGMKSVQHGGRVTLQDIARKTGYTANTVSRRLGGGGLIGDVNNGH